MHLENYQVHLVAEEVAGEADVDGCLYFVSCEHPKFNTGICQQSDSIWNTILQSVFDCRPTNKVEVPFNGVGNRFEFVLSVNDGRCGKVVLTVPDLIFFLRYFLLRNT